MVDNKEIYKVADVYLSVFIEIMAKINFHFLNCRSWGILPYTLALRKLETAIAAASGFGIGRTIPHSIHLVHSQIICRHRVGSDHGFRRRWPRKVKIRIFSKHDGDAQQAFWTVANIVLDVPIKPKSNPGAKTPGRRSCPRNQ